MDDDPLAFLRGEAVSDLQAKKSEGRTYGVVVTLETEGDGKPAERSKELIVKARELNLELGSRVAGCIFGKDSLMRARVFAYYGLDQIFVGLETESNPNQIISDALIRWVERECPDLWLFSTSAYGREFAARLAMRLNTGLVDSVLHFDLSVEDRTYEMTHLEWDGKMSRTLSMKHVRPQLATLAPGRVSPAVEDRSRVSAIQTLG